MNTRVQSHKNDDHQELHFFARMIGVLALITVALYARALLVGGFLEVSFHGELNSSILVGLLLLGVVSLLIAWRWPKLGGVMAILLSIPIAWFVGQALEEGSLFAAVIYSSPLLIAGLLFLLDARQGKAAKKAI
jgi:hypothetical protein